MKNTTNKCDESKAKYNERQRKEIPDFLKKELELSDEEYIDFFNKVEYFKDRRSIQDIKLSSGRIIKANDIKASINKMQNNMLNNKDSGDYINEVVVFQPKIQAVVMRKNAFINVNPEDSQTLSSAKANNIPVILV